MILHPARCYGAGWLSFLITLSAVADLQKGCRVGRGIEDHQLLSELFVADAQYTSPCRNCGSLWRVRAIAMVVQNS